MWFSKLQSTIETSAFRAEFAAMKQLMDALKGLRHKLRMMGVTLSESCYACSDILSAEKNSRVP